MAIVAYTDGSSLGNPGPGGFGCILLETEKKVKKEISQGFRLTTNNRMELLAVITALETLKFTNTEITIITDSKYVVDAVEKRWVFGWLQKNFKGKKNEDLWRRFLEDYKIHRVKFQWIKGHAGHHWNEEADKLAVKAANDPANFKIDSYFEIHKNEE